MSTFLERIKERAKAEKKTIVLPESMEHLKRQKIF